MNLLLLDQFSDLGGAQLCLLDLLPALLERDWNVILSAPGSGQLLQQAHALGAQIESIECGSYSRGRKTISDILNFTREFRSVTNRIRTLIAAHEIDLLYVNGPRLAAASAWAVKRAIPLFFHCHNHVAFPYNQLLVRWPLLKVNATVISSSASAARSIGLNADASKLHIVYNGVPDCARERVRNGGIHRIGMIGLILPQKGQHLFVEAARLLLRRGWRCRFEICGSAVPNNAESAAYEQTVRKFGSEVPVRFREWTSDIAPVLADLDVIAVPSVAAESAPRVILEAFSAGVPVVASAKGGIPELIEHGRTGLLVDPVTPERFADAINNLLSAGPHLTHAISTAARREWESRFTVERYRHDIVQLISRSGARQKRAEH